MSILSFWTPYNFIYLYYKLITLYFSGCLVFKNLYTSSNEFLYKDSKLSAGYPIAIIYGVISFIFKIDYMLNLN